MAQLHLRTISRPHSKTHTHTFTCIYNKDYIHVYISLHAYIFFILVQIVDTHTHTRRDVHVHIFLHITYHTILDICGEVHGSCTGTGTGADIRVFLYNSDTCSRSIHIHLRAPASVKALEQLQFDLRLTGQANFLHALSNATCVTSTWT